MIFVDANVDAGDRVQGCAVCRRFQVLVVLRSLAGILTRPPGSVGRSSTAVAVATRTGSRTKEAVCTTAPVTRSQCRKVCPDHGNATDHQLAVCSTRNKAMPTPANISAYLSRIHTVVKCRVVNIAILKVLQYYWQYFFGYCLHIANTF